MNLSQQDPSIANLLRQEQERQESTISLIASENYVSQAVLQATGSVLTNKYAEGYPGRRYYAGCQIVDQVETIAIERCKELFGSEHANVQPHAGSQANMAAYLALLKPGDTILGMNLNAGGHLTHGHSVNFSALFYNAVQYGIDSETEQLNFDTISQLAHQHRPKLIIAGASAYSRTIDFAQFKKIAQEIGAFLMADIAHIAGLVATKLHPTPVGYADIITSTTHKTLRGPRGGLILSNQTIGTKIDRAIMPGMQGGPLLHSIAAKAVAFYEAQQPSFTLYQQQIVKNAQLMADTFKTLGYRVVSGGTDNHMFVLDLRSRSITGLEAQEALEKAGITVSRSTIPNDPQKPSITSGIRIGTPAITTRNITSEDLTALVYIIDEVLQQHNNDLYLYKVKDKVKSIAQRYPLPAGEPSAYVNSFIQSVEKAI